MPTSPGRIDVHHHLFAPSLIAAMAAKGLDHVANSPLPSDWTPAASVALMDRYGIAAAIVSMPAPLSPLGGRADMRDLARSSNELAADMAARHPGRFGSFAVLPMPCTDDACAEAVHALDVLRADGVMLLGSTDGHFLGDRRFDELMAELDARDAVVFLHPNLHRSSIELGLAAPGSLIEFLCDTTRAAINLVVSGSTARYPRIRWILAHAGGFLPFVAWRFALLDAMPDYGLAVAGGVLAHVRRFYYETALSPSPYAMAAVRELNEPRHILFGSDYPFAPEALVAMEIAALDGLAVLDDDAKSGIARAHALELFPRFAVH